MYDCLVSVLGLCGESGRPAHSGVAMEHNSDTGNVIHLLLCGEVWIVLNLIQTTDHALIDHVQVISDLYSIA